MLIGSVTGNLGKPAELRQTSGGPVLSFSVASNTKVKGEKVTTWVRCSLFGKRGEALAQYLTQGTKVAVFGELTQCEYNGKTYLEMRVSELDMMGGGDRGQRAESRPAATGGGGFDDADYGAGSDSEIPFIANVTCEAGERWNR
jgi:single-strand DNA-binding protein